LNNRKRSSKETPNAPKIRAEENDSTRRGAAQKERRLV
jgi:hypothetical protein